jgi:glucose-6-phosphate dehydrogenase assembly protein OpcA
MDIERFTGGVEQPVDVAAIERELAALWRAASPPAGRDPDEGEVERASEAAPSHSVRPPRPGAVTRASALNLVVPCSEHAVDEARAVVAELVSTHPARVLLLVSELAGDRRPGAEPAPLTASVSAFCHRLRTEPRQICCELITLRARGPAEEHLADTVLALLAPDLPVAIWWAGGLLAPGQAPGADQNGGEGTGGALHRSTSSLLERLAPLMDRWIVDTASPHDAAALRQMAAQFAPRGGERPLASTVHDLAWMRLLPWRELTAQFFDPRAFRARLPELDLLEVATSASAPSDAEGLLWVAWLVERLGWQSSAPAHARPGDGHLPLAEPGGMSWRFSRPGGGERRARILSPVPASSDAVGREATVALEGVRLEATTSETTFTISRTPGTDCATLTVATRGACPLPRAVSLPRPRTAQLLAASLDEPNSDPLYLAALSLAAELQVPSA